MESNDPVRRDDPRDLPEQRSRRTFSELEPGRRKLRDTDPGARSVRAFALVGAVAGLVLGGALGFFLTAKDMAPTWVVVLCPLVGAVSLASMTLWIANSAGAAASTLYAPSGKSTARNKEYSQAEAMVAQGRYEDGITAFELAVSEDATDPTPYLRIARVYRDQLSRHDDAARWFRRALRESAIPPGVAFLARKELVEVYSHRLGQPERALPELARMAEELEGTEEGAWAARQLAEIKAGMSNRSLPPEEDPETSR